MRFCLTSSCITFIIFHFANATDSNYSSQEAPPKSKSAGLLTELILKNDCFANHDSLQAISICLKTKLLVNLNELIRTNRTIEISGFDFIKTNPLSVEIDNSLDESLNEIPDDTDNRSLEDDSYQLTHLIFKRMWQFLQTRSVRLDMGGNEASGVDDEGRKKKDKGGMMMMMAMGIKGMIMQMMMAKVAMIAVKALTIGKIALILSAIMALKKLMQQGGGSGGGHSDHVSTDWSSRRLFEDNRYATEMAYSAYAPTLISRK